MLQKLIEKRLNAAIIPKTSHLFYLFAHIHPSPPSPIAISRKSLYIHFSRFLQSF